MSLLASRIWSSATSPAHCSANAAHEPTRPPPPIIVTFMLSLHLCHNLIGDGLHGGFRVCVVAHGRLWFRRNRAGDARTPFVVVAKFAFLESVPRIGNAEALLDLQQVLQLSRGERVRRFAQLRGHQ